MWEPSAFPINTAGNIEPQGGMTLRDYFAAAALPALLQPHMTDVAINNIGFKAYALADALMKERAALEEKE